MKRTFFARRSLLILVIIFFFIPFGMRGARLALRSMKNDIKDWLPTTYKETGELDWFRRNFLGEQFVICTWEGCTADDTRLRLLQRKLLPKFPPVLGMSPKQQARHAELEEFVRENYELFLPENSVDDWGGLQEKWFQGRGDKWYYLTPDGGLHLWKGRQTVLGLLGRKWSRMMKGKSVDGELKVQLAPIDYEHPRRIEAPYFKTVITGPQILDQMSREAGPLRAATDRTEEEARAVAMQRLEGFLFGPDGKQTSLIVTLTEVGRSNLMRVVGRGLPGQPRGKLVRLAEESGINAPARPPLLAIPSLGIGVPVEPPAPSLKMGGPPVDNVAIDEEGQITLVRLVGLCGLLGIGLAFYCFRSLNATIMLFFVGGVAAMCALGAVWWLGSSVDAVLMSMPAVVYVLGLSGAVHIMNYYRDAIEEHGIEGAPERAVAHGWLPCTLAAVTTAIGLGSLYVSELAPIKKFGLFSAIGVMGTLILLFTYLPAALQTWPPTLRIRTAASQRKRSAFEAGFLRWMTGIGNGIIRHNVATALVCVIVFAVLSYGLTKIKTSVHLIKMFDAKAKIIHDYRWIENNLGKLVPMELVVRIDKRMLLSALETDDENSAEAATTGATDGADGASAADEAGTKVHPLLKYPFLGRLEAAARTHQVIEREFGPEGNGVVGRGMSVLTFAPDLPEAGAGIRQGTFRRVFSKNMEVHRDEFVETDYLRDDKDDGAELWRISIRLAALKDIDYGAFVADLKRAVEPIMTAYRFRDDILLKIIDDNDGDIAGSQVLVLGIPYVRYAAEEATRQAKAEMEAQDAAAKLEKEATAKESEDEGATLESPVESEEDSALAKADLDSTFEHQDVDQTEIFAMTLKDLLVNAGLRFRVHDPSGKTAPTDSSESEAGDDEKKKKLAENISKLLTNDLRRNLEEDLQDGLAGAEYVLLVSDHESYDLDALREEFGERLIDLRDHHYDPAEEEDSEYSVLTDEAEKPSVATIYTGVVPVVYKAQRTLLNNLVTSFGLAFGLIAIVMCGVLRNPAAALVSMFPNVFPVAVVFGAMGWLGIHVDIGTMMTASVAMGVAVDDTIHFLTWYRWGLDAGLSRQDAIRATYRRVARAMAQTTAIGGLGMAVFALSTFTPTQRFGSLMLTLLAAALVGDLIFLPALLAGPLGRVFSGSSKDKQQDDQQPPTGESESPGDSPQAGDAVESTTAPAAPDGAPPDVAGDDATGPCPPPPHVSSQIDVGTDHVALRQDTPHSPRQP